MFFSIDIITYIVIRQNVNPFREKGKLGHISVGYCLYVLHNWRNYAMKELSIRLYVLQGVVLL